jgi:hypothetical protein
MKVYASIKVEFRKAAVSPTSFMIEIDWITETGIAAGVSDKIVNLPKGLTLNGLNDAIADAVKETINASGLYTVAKNDTLILFGAADSISRF